MLKCREEYAMNIDWEVSLAEVRVIHVKGPKPVLICGVSE